MIYRNRALLLLIAMMTAGVGLASVTRPAWPQAVERLESDALADAATAPAPIDPGAAVGTAGELGSADSAAPLTADVVPFPAAPAPPADDPPIAELGATPHTWQPWAPNSGSFHVSANPGSALLAAGGMWRLMSAPGFGNAGVSAIANSQAEGLSAHTAAAVADPTTSESPAAPPTLPASGSEPPAPSIVTPPTGGSASDGRATGSTGTGTGPGNETASVGGGSGGAGGVADAAAPGPDPLDEPSGGGFEPGGFEPAGSDTPASGGGVSPTPEPGSVLLVGSGLLGILGLLRKRRLI